MEGSLKLTRDLAQAQAARLQSCPMLCPQSREGRAEIVDCLLRNCQDAVHAERTMTLVLDSALHVDGALTALIASFARECQSTEQAPPGCYRCDDGKDVEGAQRWFDHVETRNGGFGRCDCPRGLWLAARDLERRNKQSAKPQKRSGKGMRRVSPPAED